jgi:hypothetical protein
VTIVRALAGAALAAAAVLPAVSASATECEPKRPCGGACYIDREASDLTRLIRCYS